MVRVKAENPLGIPAGFRPFSLVGVEELGYYTDRELQKGSGFGVQGSDVQREHRTSNPPSSRRPGGISSNGDDGLDGGSPKSEARNPNDEPVTDDREPTTED